MTRQSKVWAALGVLLMVATARADWYVNDDHKMHYPQMPNEVGWDIELTQGTIADDFKCAQTGTIDDIHFWISWRNDNIGQIQEVVASIYSDIPAGSDPDPQVTISHPGELLWSGLFGIDAIKVIDYGTGSQGWYDPFLDEPLVVTQDHLKYQQVNITGIEKPFYQREGIIYWLALQVIPTSNNFQVGWKTSLDVFNDAAVIFTEDNSGAATYQALSDPTIFTHYVPLNMAFVITPEPTTIAMLVIGIVALTSRRR